MKRLFLMCAVTLLTMLQTNGQWQGFTSVSQSAVSLREIPDPIFGPNATSVEISFLGAYQGAPYVYVHTLYYNDNTGKPIQFGSCTTTSGGVLTDSIRWIGICRNCKITDLPQYLYDMMVYAQINCNPNGIGCYPMDSTWALTTNNCRTDNDFLTAGTWDVLRRPNALTQSLSVNRDVFLNNDFTLQQALNVNFNAKFQVNSGKTLTIDNGGYVRTSGYCCGTVNPGGTIVNNGTIRGNLDLKCRSVVNNGTLSPGSIPSIFLNTGSFRNLTLSPTSTVNLKMGGTSNSNIDRFYVDDTTRLGGTLKVTFTPGFVPKLNDRFMLVEMPTTSAPIEGSFSRVILPPGVVGTVTKEIDNRNYKVVVLTITGFTNCTISGSATSTNASCFGSSTGSITVQASGGIPPYQYRLGTTGTFTTSNTFTGLRASTYRVFFQDAIGCTGSVVVTVGQPTEIVTTVTTTDAGCFGEASGSIAVTNTTGGVGSYSFATTATGPFTTNSILSGLRAGSYRLFTRDANNCQVASNIIAIGQPARITTTFTPIDATCFGSATGSIININSTGGAGGHTQSLALSGPFAAVTSFAGLRKNTYRIFTRDAAGCSSFTDPIVINQLNAIAIAFTKTDVGCTTGAAGSITVTSATGGSGSGYAYSLSASGPFTANATFTGLRAGNYRIYCRDGLGCVSFTGIINIAGCSIVKVLRPSMAVSQTEQALHVSPNPSTGLFTVQLPAGRTGNCTLTITNEMGTIIGTRQVSAVKGNTTAIDLQNQAPGVYFIKAIVNNRLQAARVVVAAR